ncbi:MAG TPA: hypothetical protein ENK43_10155 [Planctomycetes bacterium]|nr:hypothetical protein [Planctomycetota bacterium]
MGCIPSCKSKQKAATPASPGRADAIATTTATGTGTTPRRP